MYEFLAPWGVIAPAVTALLTYLVISEIRRKRMMHHMDPPEGPLVPVHWRIDPSNLA